MDKDFMKHAQEIQNRMVKVQEKLGKHEISGYAGGGLIEVVCSGKLDPVSVQISREVFQGQLDEDTIEKLDLTKLEELVLAAFRDAKERVEKHVQNEMASVTGGLDLGQFGL